ncbi:hypothetical protein BIW11_02436 [Tropilaelaps mercedesae]|uniref:Transmembrane protein-like n=1 Tax=Tropilaelaps mercedesae TaxID=418985 RepID=A0A1V9Y386_9ACAR|nr:hypothetical protein BIW11_02436 [Tropilaelaps mercedesae]
MVTRLAILASRAPVTAASTVIDGAAAGALLAFSAVEYHRETCRLKLAVATLVTSTLYWKGLPKPNTARGSNKNNRRQGTQCWQAESSAG